MHRAGPNRTLNILYKLMYRLNERLLVDASFFPSYAPPKKTTVRQ